MPTTLKLAAANTITVGNFRIGDGSGGQSTHVLTLGTGANVINATTTNIGSAGTGIRSGGSMIFDLADTTGTLTLNGFGGAGTRTILNMINTSGNTAVFPTSIVNPAGHTSTVNVSTLTMATRTQGAGATSTLTFDQGTLDVTTLNMANRSGTAGVVTATVDLSDSVAAGVPTVTIGGITMAVSASASVNNAIAALNISGGNVSIGSGSGTAINMANAGIVGATATSALNITGGSVTVTGNMIRTVGAGTETATLALNGANAVLDMSGKNIISLTGITYTDGTLKNLGTVNTGVTLAGTGSRIFDQDAASLLGNIHGAITGTGLGLTKQGLGQLALSGANTYDGPTVVSGGTLLINGDHSLATGGITVAAGAVVGGSGTLGGALTVNGTFAPGTNPGTMTTSGAVTFNAGSVLNYELVGNDFTVGGAVNDLLTGVVNLTLGGTLNVTEIGVGSFAGATEGNTWRLMNYTGTLTGALALGTTPGLSGGRSFEVTAGGGQVNLVVVPEPTTTVTLLAGLGLLLGRRRG